MGENSAIEWTDHTWNPWRGCTKVSQGCKHCYMYRDQTRFGHDPEVVTRAADATFRFPLSKKVKPGDRVFACSWSDWFHEAADEWRGEAWKIIKARPDVIFQILTKRPDRFFQTLPWMPWQKPWPNVWLGVSIEDQATAEVRIRPLAYDQPAAVKFISYEPALGPVQLHRWLDRCPQSQHMWEWPHQWRFDGDDPYVICDWCHERRDAISNRVIGPRRSKSLVDWVICGGESGPHARPMHPDWARSVRDQCQAAGVPFFFKQWGEWEIACFSNGHFGSLMPDTGEKYTWLGIDGRTQNPSSHGLDEAYSMARVGKKAAGALLDGREWREVPGGKCEMRSDE